MKMFSAALAAVLCGVLAHADHRPDTHAPIGVMGDHTHQAGEVMLSYRYMHMSMTDNRDGTDDLRPEEIALLPNTFGMPPTLRVVPTDMTMEMHMLGAMWAPSDRITLMGMVNYIEKEMDHVTFAGPAGDTVRGRFTTRTSGLSDTSLSALIGLGDSPHGGWHATLGVSLPTGSIDETDSILNPMGMRPTIRLPYPMQLGSGTYDLIAGLTYAALFGDVGVGAQWRSVVRLGENDEDYTLGDEHLLSVWGSYRISSSVSAALRFTHTDRGNIRGRDTRIAGPVQTADPDRQGFARTEMGLSLNWAIPETRHRLAMEIDTPIHEDLDGPQMKRDWTLTLGWQFTP